MLMRRRVHREYRGAVQISDLFAAYKKRFRPPQGVVVTTFCAVVETELGVALSRTQVRYSVHTRTLSVQANGPLKSELLLRQKRLLELCGTVLGAESVPTCIV